MSRVVTQDDLFSIMRSYEDRMKRLERAAAVGNVVTSLSSTGPITGIGEIASSRDSSNTQQAYIRGGDANGNYLGGRSTFTNRKPTFIESLFSAGTGTPAGATGLTFRVGDVAAPTTALTISEGGAATFAKLVTGTLGFNGSLMRPDAAGAAFVPGNGSNNNYGVFNLYNVAGSSLNGTISPSGTTGLVIKANAGVLYLDSGSANEQILFRDSAGTERARFTTAGHFDIAYELIVSGGAITLDNATANVIAWGSSGGVSAPAATSTPLNVAGAKLKLYTNTYGLGIESGHLWYVGSTGHKFYTGSGALQATINSGGIRSEEDVTLRRIQFLGVNSNSSAVGLSYGIYQEAGAWTSPYPRLAINFHTGINFRASYQYGGIRFYTPISSNTDTSGLTFDIGNGDGAIRSYATHYLWDARFIVNTWHRDNNGYDRFYFENGSITYNNSPSGHWFRIAGADKMTLSNSGLTLTNHLYISGGHEIYFGGSSSGERIRSWRSGGDNQSGIDFITAGSLRGYLRNNGWFRMYGPINGMGDPAFVVGDGDGLPYLYRRSLQDVGFYHSYRSDGVSGHAWVSAQGYNTFSDERLKDSVETSSGYLEKLKKVRPVRYKLKERSSGKDERQASADGEKPKKVSRSTLGASPDRHGFVAQEIAAIFPELVSGDPDATDEKFYLSIEYQGFIPMLVDAVKELSTERDALAARVSALEAKSV